MPVEPIRFTCSATLPMSPERIAGQILDLARWPTFQGYGVLPGIRSAEFERQTPDVIGTRIRVANTDGSTHVEEVVAWDLPHHVALRMEGFSAPLSRLATHFLESWRFTRQDARTRVERTIAVHPRSTMTRPPLWLISLLLRRAIARHLEVMNRATIGEGSAIS